ncbi:MAG TPA: hypothetical protein VGG72_19970 [Bryobacteraceae bacterium]|jgi:hypothetical protein
MGNEENENEPGSALGSEEGRSRVLGRGSNQREIGDFYAASVCGKSLSTETLRTHLYAVQAGNKGKEEVAAHLAESNCLWCKERVEALRATEPFLRGKRTANVEVHATVVEDTGKQIQATVETERERALEALTEALIAVILGREDLSQQVDQLERQFFEKPPGILREEVSFKCRAKHRSIPKAMQRKVQGYWSSVVDGVASGEPTILVRGLSNQEAAAFRMWALGESWMLAAQGVPWSVEQEKEDIFRLLIQRKAVIEAVETAKDLRPSEIAL